MSLPRTLQAAALNSILSESWAPRVGACVAAARYLHHMVRASLQLEEDAIRT